MKKNCELYKGDENCEKDQRCGILEYIDLDEEIVSGLKNSTRRIQKCIPQNWFKNHKGYSQDNCLDEGY